MIFRNFNLALLFTTRDALLPYRSLGDALFTNGSLGDALPTNGSLSDTLFVNGSLGIYGLVIGRVFLGLSMLCLEFSS